MKNIMFNFSLAQHGIVTIDWIPIGDSNFSDLSDPKHKFLKTKFKNVSLSSYKFSYKGIG